MRVYGLEDLDSGDRGEGIHKKNFHCKNPKRQGNMMKGQAQAASAFWECLFKLLFINNLKTMFSKLVKSRASIVNARTFTAPAIANFRQN